MGTFTLKDAYGKSSETRVVLVTYSKATVDRIDYGAVDFKRAWELADERTFVHPSFEY